MKNIIFKRAETEQELLQVLELQTLNLAENISDQEITQEGFVTVVHDFDLLKRMNEKAPHIIAKHHDKVIGYTLVMLQEFKDEIPILQPMFVKANNILDHDSYVAMGQVCIDKAFRRQGVFRGLYEFMKSELKGLYKMTITEVSKTNTRSLAAHYAIGFRQLVNNVPEDEDWELIYWDWS